jgi:hypothetical protein
MNKEEFLESIKNQFKNSNEQFNGFYCDEGYTTSAGKINFETVSGNLDLRQIPIDEPKKSGGII